LRQNKTKNKLVTFIITEKNKINKEYLTLLFFIIIATFLWFINALNKDYIAEISYPVKFINNNKKLILISKFPKSLNLTVKTDGYTILKNNLSFNTIPIIINIDKNFKYLKNKNKLYFATNATKSIINKKLENNNILIYNINPDTIFAEYTKTINKKVKIVPNIHFKLKQQFLLKQIMLNPDSINVTGAKIILDTLKNIKTEKLDIGIIDKSIKRNIKLSKINNVNFDKNRVDIKLIVEKFTQAKIKIPVKIINIPDTSSIMLIPSTVTVSYNVSLNDFKKIKAKDFKIIFDYSKTSESKKFSSIKLVKYPSFIKNIELSPQQVKYIIYKND